MTRSSNDEAHIKPLFHNMRNYGPDPKLHISSRHWDKSPDILIKKTRPHLSFNRHQLNPTVEIGDALLNQIKEESTKIKSKEGFDMETLKIMAVKSGIRIALDKGIYAEDPTLEKIGKNIVTGIASTLIKNYAEDNFKFIDNALSSLDSKQKDILLSITSSLLVSSAITQSLPDKRTLILTSVPEMVGSYVL